MQSKPRVEVHQVRRAVVMLGDDETEVRIEALYESSGEFAELNLTQIHEDRILGDITICELGPVIRFVEAILGVLPPVTAASIRGGV